MRRSTVLSLTPQLVFPGQTLCCISDEEKKVLQHRRQGDDAVLLADREHLRLLRVPGPHRHRLQDQVGVNPLGNGAWHRLKPEICQKNSDLL